MSTATKRFNGIIQELNISGASSGPLAGLKFATKDLFDVKGEVTGVGNPTYAQTHAPAKANAAAVEKLLNAGASLIAKTCTDEFACSLDGINSHFGTPHNPQYPDRIPGGSSSGSASAVAAGLVDFALGTDTGGSIRVPASYCGCFGFRPSHDRVSLEGVAPLAQLMDAVGWMARNPHILESCAIVLMDEKPSEVFPKKLLIARDFLADASIDFKAAIEKAVDGIAEKFDIVEDVQIESFGWGSLAAIYRSFQAPQAWKNYGSWMRDNISTVEHSIRERFEFASTVTGEDFETAKIARDKVLSDMAQLLSDDAVLCMPTTLNLPPLIDSSDDELLKNRVQNMNRTALAPLSRVPEVCIPIPVTDKTTTGLSFLARHGNDMMLLNLSRQIWANS